MATRVNGIEVDALKETIGAVKKDRELGRCKFRVSNRWLRANQNASKVGGFYAAKAEQQHKEAFEVRADEPPLLAGEDSAANPVEHLLMALASCLTTAMVAHAATRGIDIEEVESEVEGDIDLNGYMGIKADVPKGYQRIRVNFSVRSDADEKQLRELAWFSPVANTILNGAEVDVSVARSPMRKAAGAQQERHP